MNGCQRCRCWLVLYCNLERFGRLAGFIVCPEIRVNVVAPELTDVTLQERDPRSSGARLHRWTREQFPNYDASGVIWERHRQLQARAGSTMSRML